MGWQWLLFIAVMAPLVSGLATLVLPRRVMSLRVLLACLGPGSSFALILGALLSQSPGTLPSAQPTAVIPWVGMVHLNLAWFVDGLGGFFGLLIAGIGVLIVLYARGYFGPNKDDLYRFYPTLGFFTTAMLGIVLADYTLLTLLFWEATSISSFLLIGWDRYDRHAVRLAMQAFFTTGLGGMALLGGVLLLGYETDIWRWSELLRGGFETSPAVWWALGLMLIGAGTKSAQWPFHYWLPGAMAAPTPVSAYLHSATMVKAGVFLVGRLFPVFGAVGAATYFENWPMIVIPIGAVTMLYGAVLALQQHDLKRIFAYTTVSQLGLFMAMYGLGGLGYAGHAAESGHALAAAGQGVKHAAGALHAGLNPAIDFDITQIANHAFYKAPLFIIAGALGHVASRNLTELHGIWRKHKAMTLTILLAGYALAAGPGTISFQAKEIFVYAISHARQAIGWWAWVVMAMTVLTAACNVAIFVRLFTTLLGLPGSMGRNPPQHHEDAHPVDHTNDAEAHHHEGGFWGAMLWVPGLILVMFQYLGGLYTPWWNTLFMPLERMVNYSGFAGHVPALWQVHPGLPLLISVIAILIGLGLGLLPLLRGAVVDIHDRIFPAMYWLCVHGGKRAFGFVQDGHLRHYLVIVFGALLIGFAGAVMLNTEMIGQALSHFKSIFEFPPGLFLGVLVCATALALPLIVSRVVRVLTLGACGFTVVGIYLIYQAPDLALTQLMFEIISVILFVLVLRLLPTDLVFVSKAHRLWRAVLGAAVGLMFGWMTLVAASTPLQNDQKLGYTFAQQSYSNASHQSQAHPPAHAPDQPAQAQQTGLNTPRGGGGNNIVNVILVDFRGFDTLGEITVLTLAAMGVWSLLPGSWWRRRQVGLARDRVEGEMAEREHDEQQVDQVGQPADN